MAHALILKWLQKDWIIATAVVVVIVAAGLVLIGQVMVPQTTLYLGDGVYHARIAATPSAREKGLGGTINLAPHHAMLFVFETSDRWGIWMKDMQYSIDVVWLNEQKQVVYSVSNMSPDSYPKEFTPNMPARYVVELPAGAIAKRAITIGTQARFELPGGER